MKRSLIAVGEAEKTRTTKKRKTVQFKKRKLIVDVVVANFRIRRVLIQVGVPSVIVRRVSGGSRVT